MFGGVFEKSDFNLIWFCKIEFEIKWFIFGCYSERV